MIQFWLLFGYLNFQFGLHYFRGYYRRFNGFFWSNFDACIFPKRDPLLIKKNVSLLTKNFILHWTTNVIVIAVVPFSVKALAKTVIMPWSTSSSLVNYNSIKIKELGISTILIYPIYWWAEEVLKRKCSGISNKFSYFVSHIGKAL